MSEVTFTPLSRERTRVSRRAWIQLLLGVLLYGAGANVSAGFVVVLAAVTIGAVPWAAIVARRAAGSIEVRRLLPDTATAGAPTAVRLEARARTVARAVVEDDLTGAVGIADGLRSGVELRTRASLARGRPEAGRITVTVSDPFGLVSVRCAADVPAPVEVLPAVPEITVGTLATRAARVGGRDAHRTGHGTEVVGVREHHRGDPVRAVDWRATARHGDLVVRELTEDARAPLTVELAEGTWPRPCLDRACEAAAGAAAGAARAGLQVRLAADGAVMAWDERARHWLAMLPPHAGAEPRPLAGTETSRSDVRLRLAPSGDGTSVRGTLLAGGDRHGFGPLPADADLDVLTGWLRLGLERPAAEHVR